MFENFYLTISKLGYTHPLHPTVTHLPIGLILGGFIFALIATLFRQTSFTTTARHCMILAFVALLPTLLLGYGDWKHFYGGAYLFEIKMKFVLAGLLVVFLLILVIAGFKTPDITINQLPLYLMAVVLVIGIGYFGGDLVYGKKASKNPVSVASSGRDTKLVQKGQDLFSQRCAFCHAADTTEPIVGPGLKGLFTQERFPVSRLPATAESVQRLFTKPFKDMPPFNQLTKEETAALLAYLEIL